MKGIHCFQTKPKYLLNDFGNGTRKRRFEFLNSPSEVRQLYDLKYNFISNSLDLRFKAFTERIQKLTQYNNLIAIALIYNLRFTLYAITYKNNILTSRLYSQNQRFPKTICYFVTETYSIVYFTQF